MSQPFFRIGEFAHLCGVKKDTLFHYDHMGLLKPSRIAPNGYRYYAAQQYFTFQIIAALREVGMSLGEIRDYLGRQSAGNLLPLLEEKQLQMAAQRRRLEQLEQLLLTTADAIREQESHRPGDLFLQWQPAMDLAVTPAFDDLDKSHLQVLRDHVQRCRDGGSPNYFLLGGLVPFSNLARGIWREEFFWTPAGPDFPAGHLYRKPAGLYAVYYHQGNYDSLPATYQEICRTVADGGYCPAGDLFEEDLLNFLSEADESRYLLKLNLLVRPDPRNPSPRWPVPPLPPGFQHLEG